MSRPDPTGILPHRYPFLLVDSVEEDEEGRRVAVLVLSTSAVTRGRRPPELPAVLAVEILAQASLVLGAPDDAGDASDDSDEEGREPGLLAGIDDAAFDEELTRRPLAPGDRLRARTEIRGSFGRLTKVQGVLERDGRRVAEATLLLASG